MMWQDQAKLKMDMVKDAFWDYVAKATQTTEDMMQKIRESDMGQEIKWVAKESGVVFAYPLGTHVCLTIMLAGWERQTTSG